MSSLWTKVLSGTSPSSKNVHIQVHGYLEKESVLDWERVVDVKDVAAKSLRLDAVNFALSDKLEVLLAWHNEGDEPHVFLPLNGRGRLDFDSVNGLQNTVGEGKTGDVLLQAHRLPSATGRTYFTLTLDFSKQGS